MGAPGIGDDDEVGSGQHRERGDLTRSVGADLENQEKTLNEEMAALDPDDRMATVEKAYEFEKVQTALQEALNDWESTTDELETLESSS